MVLPLRSGKVAPAWDVPCREFSSLTADVRADVAIIGGGIAGLAAALSLSERGVRVALVEGGRIGEGSSGWCGGILSASTTVDLAAVEAAFGANNAKRILDAVHQALERYSGLFADVGWQKGNSLYLAARKRHARRFAKELQVSRQFGVQARALTAQELQTQWNGFHDALSVSQEHAVNPVALLQAIAQRAQSQGALIFERTQALGWTAENGVVTVRTAGGVIRAQHLVIATGLSGMDEAERKRIDAYLVPVTGHIVVTEPSPHVAALAREGGVIAAWDTLALYHYVRYMADGRMMIGGGEEAGVAAAEAIATDETHARELLRWAQRHHNFPIPPAQSAWRATLIFPADGLPFVQTSEVDGSRIVSVVTDGLPFAITLGEAIGAVVQTGGHWLADCLSTRRRMPLAAKLARLTPRNKLLRSLIHKAIFKVVELFDRM